MAKKTTPVVSPFSTPFFIFNPAAGTTDPDKVRRIFQEACTQFGWQAEVHETKKGEDLAPVVLRGLQNGCDVVMAGGGDGTVSAVASALVGSDIALAIVPVGTANLLARGLNLPMQLEKTFAALAHSKDVLKLDVMRIEERFYVLNCSVGISSNVMENTSRASKNRFGMAAYIWTTLRRLTGIQPHRFHLVIDGVHHIVRASEVFISDSMFLIGEVVTRDIKVEADDGQLEVFVVKARTLWDYFLLLIDMVLGRTRHSLKMSYFPAREQIEIYTRRPLTVQADGEIVCNTPVTVEVVPKAVRVLLPGTPSS